MDDHLKIGFLGGTFDPIHLGHIDLANQFLESHRVDEVWVCPTSLSPDKVSRPPVASAQDRFEMAKIAASEHPQINVISNEIQKDGVAYTIDTIRELRKANSDHTFFLLLAEGCDPVKGKWKEAEELVTLVTPLHGTQKRVEVSSTELRSMFKNGVDPSPFLNPKVLDYIQRKQLY